MENWIEFARGPLFTITFLIMVLGLLRQIVLQIYFLTVNKGRRLSNAPWNRMIKDALTWVIPIKHIIPGSRIFSISSFLMHIGLIIVPLFLMDHIVLWEAFTGWNLPAIGKSFADYLTLFTIACILILLCCRTFIARHRVMSQPMDYVLLIITLIPFMSGYLASHPNVNPFPWKVMMLTHLLGADALFILIPFTKLSHIVMFFFDRISAVHWQLRPGAGDKVAEALFGKEARV